VDASRVQGITAALLAALVEDGVLNREQTIGVSFPELAAAMPAH